MFVMPSNSSNSELKISDPSVYKDCMNEKGSYLKTDKGFVKQQNGVNQN